MKDCTKKLERLGCFVRKKSAIGPKGANNRRTSGRATTTASAATTGGRVTDIHAIEVCTIIASDLNFELAKYLNLIDLILRYVTKFKKYICVGRHDR